MKVNSDSQKSNKFQISTNWKNRKPKLLNQKIKDLNCKQSVINPKVNKLVKKKK